MEDNIAPRKCHCVNNPIGIMLVLFLYTLLSFLYFITVYYGIWGYNLDGTSTVSRRVNNHELVYWDVFNTLLFSIFFILMLWAHAATVLT